MDLHFGFVGLLCHFSQCPLSAVRELAEESKAYFVGDRPMMTTDAPYWLRWQGI